MAIKVSRDELTAETSDLHDIWRLVRPYGPAGVGVAAFTRLPDRRDPSLWRSLQSPPDAEA